MAARANHVDYMSFSISYKILFLTFVFQQLVGGVFDLEARFTIKDSSDLVILLELLGHCNVSLKVRDFSKTLMYLSLSHLEKNPDFPTPKKTNGQHLLKALTNKAVYLLFRTLGFHY